MLLLVANALFITFMAYFSLRPKASTPFFFFFQDPAVPSVPSAQCAQCAQMIRTTVAMLSCGCSHINTTTLLSTSST